MNHSSDPMPKDRSFVRASDIGTWTFCNRAWWLAHVQTSPHERSEMLAWGNQTHAAHRRLVSHAQWQRKIGLILLAGGLLLLGFLLLQFFVASFW